ncbi:MAG: DUF4269 domain-containing protein [Candidatus Kapaibacterium sp.]|nr:MAG: DUF4269 domain-containing protein [Candidatus Kapabacteria bacterium]
MHDHLTQTLKTLHSLCIFDILAPFSPTLAGTIPLGVDIEGSDADIICFATDFEVFRNVVCEQFSGQKDFAVKEVEIKGVASFIASFSVCHASSTLHGSPLWIEIFAQAVPVWEQAAVRHYWVEQRLLWLGDDHDRKSIQHLKRQGMKTEPAFARYFELNGEPYSVLFELFSASDDELQTIIQKTTRTNVDL